MANPQAQPRKEGRKITVLLQLVKFPNLTNAIIILEMGVLWVSYPLRYRFRSVTFPLRPLEFQKTLKVFLPGNRSYYEQVFASLPGEQTNKCDCPVFLPFARDNDPENQVGRDARQAARYQRPKPLQCSSSCKKQLGGFWVFPKLFLSSKMAKSKRNQNGLMPKNAPRSPQTPATIPFYRRSLL